MIDWRTVFMRWFVRELLERLRGRNTAKIEAERVDLVLPWGQVSTGIDGTRLTPRQANLMPRVGGTVNILTVGGIDYVGATGDSKRRRQERRVIARGGGVPVPKPMPYQPYAGYAHAEYPTLKHRAFGDLEPLPSWVTWFEEFAGEGDGGIILT